MAKNTKFLVTIFGALLVGLASWSLYQLMNQFVEDTLLNFGISSVYIQNGIIVLFVVLLLVAFGVGFKKSIRRIVG